MTSLLSEPLFKTGQLVLTPGFSALAGDNHIIIAYALVRRHERGDWGDDNMDSAINDENLKTDDMGFLSNYTVNGEVVWVITDYGRETTTILLPDEY